MTNTLDTLILLFLIKFCNFIKHLAILLFISFAQSDRESYLWIQLV